MTTLSTRRGVLAAACATLACPGFVLANGTGSVYRNDLVAPQSDGFGPQTPPARTIEISTPATTTTRNGVLVPSSSTSGQGRAPGMNGDAWKRALLQGDRTLLISRGQGPVSQITYLGRDGAVDERGYRELCWLMRDVRGNAAIPMDLGLLDVLCGLQRWARHNGVNSIIRVTSGYRSRHTNAQTEGAAKNSLHTQGRAADFFMDGISRSQQGAMVREFNSSGGTGIYLAKNFIHADTGRARVWRG